MSKDECGSCLERRAPYPKNLSSSSSSSSSGWSFWKSSSNKSDDACGCGEKPKEDPSKKESKDECKPKEEAYKPKDDCKKGNCPPFPSSDVPVLCMPAWFKCPPQITVPPYPCPKGVDIRPISEGGRNSKCEGGKCGKCGAERAASGPPKVSPMCPMVRPKCGVATAVATAKKPEGFLSKITSIFGFGKDKDKK